jgi:ATP-dependent exoDNAse (exonuclease V) alpha subunit
MDNHAWVSRVFRELKEVDGLVIDEISMMPSYVLDLLVSVILRINSMRMVIDKPPIKVILSGDFLQLPPIVQNDSVPIPYAFKAGWWNQMFQNQTLVLKKIWRQASPEFQAALTHARHGNGMATALTLKALGVKYLPEPFYAFDGMSIYPTNQSVDKHNRTRLDQLDGEGFSLLSERWGELNGASELYEIPEAIALKIGCRVRFTSNGPELKYANGQLGTLVSIIKEENTLIPVIRLENGVEIELERHTRFHYRKATEDDKHLIMDMDKVKWYFEEYPRLLADRTVPFYNPYMDSVCTAAVSYYPIVLGYAATIHKTQGLQFDRLQIDIRNRQAGNPQMVYVALSRLKSPEGLVIVGSPDQLMRRCVTSPEVMSFI